MDEVPFERDVERVVDTRTERSPRPDLTRLRIGGGIALILGVALAALNLGPGFAAFAFGLGVVILRASATPGERRTVQRTTRVHLRIGPTAIEVDGEAPVPLERIAAAYHQPRKDGRGTVRCEDASGGVLLEAVVANDDEAQEMLRAIGRDIARRRYRVAIGRPSDAVLGTLLPLVAMIGLAVLTHVVLAAIGITGTIAALASATVAIGVLVHQARAGHCEIAADGIVARWHGSVRYVPWAKVQRIDLEPGGSRLTVEGEPPLFLRPSGARGEAYHLRRETLHAKLLASWHAPRTVSGESTVDLLARGGQSVAEWRRRLETVREGDYRAGAAPDEDLWRVVEDSEASAATRAAAALALRADESAAPRLRVAADTVASPHLRIALERAADPAATDSEIEEALAQVAVER